VSVPTIKDIQKLHGKFVDQLTSRETSTLNFCLLQGGKLGVTLDISPAIPEAELDRARFMKLSLEERDNLYPRVIEVELTETN
jgi:hypothetical protein